MSSGEQHAGGGFKAGLAPRRNINSRSNGMPDLLILLCLSLESSSSHVCCILLRNGALRTKIESEPKFHARGYIHLFPAGAARFVGEVTHPMAPSSDPRCSEPCQPLQEVPQVGHPGTCRKPTMTCRPGMTYCCGRELGRFSLSSGKCPLDVQGALFTYFLCQCV